MTKVTRRDFLALGAATTAGILFGGCAELTERGENDNGFQTLEVQWLYKTLNGLKTKLRSYNGQSARTNNLCPSGRSAACPYKELVDPV
jgi:hypothetical protein